MQKLEHDPNHSSTVCRLPAALKLSGVLGYDTYLIRVQYERPRATISRVFLKSSSSVEHPTFSAIVCYR